MRGVAFSGPAAGTWDIGLWEGSTGGNGGPGSAPVLGRWGSCWEPSLPSWRCSRASGEGLSLPQSGESVPTATLSCSPEVARRVPATVRLPCLHLCSPVGCQLQPVCSSEPLGPADGWGCESAAGTRPPPPRASGTIPRFGGFLPTWQGALVNSNLLSAGSVSVRWEREARSQVQLGFPPSVFR